MGEDSKVVVYKENATKYKYDVKLYCFKIIYKGGTSNSIEIDGYEVGAILVDIDTTSMNYKEVYNSGTLSGSNGNTMIVVVEKYITDYLDITKETKVKIRATAINKKVEF